MILKTITKTMNEEVIFHEGIKDFSYIRINHVVNNLVELEKYIKDSELVIYDVSEDDKDLENIKVVFYKQDNLKVSQITKNSLYLMNDQGQTIEKIM